MRKLQKIKFYAMPSRILPYVYVHISSDGHSLLTCILPFEVILSKFEVVLVDPYENQHLLIRVFHPMMWK